MLSRLFSPHIQQDVRGKIVLLILFNPVHQQKLSFIKIYIQVTWQAFLHTHRHTSIHLCLSNHFEVWVSCVKPQYFATFLFGFSVPFLENELIPLLDVLKTGFATVIIEMVCFAVENTGSETICRTDF